MNMIERGLSEERRMLRDPIRAFVDGFVAPFIRKNRQEEWDMTPENRPSRELLEEAQKIGVRTLGIPEEFGGTPVDRGSSLPACALPDRAARRLRPPGKARQSGGDKTRVIRWQ